MQLSKTYEAPDVHDRWSGVYRNDPAIQKLDAAIYDWVFREVDPGRPWLDAGCGSGEHTVRLALRSPEVYAVDLSRAAIDRAAATAADAGVAGRVQFEIGGLENLVLGPRFGNVHCRGVLMHIPEWRVALRNLCAALEPGGSLVLFEANCRSLEAAAVCALRRFGARKSRLDRTPGGLEFWAEHNGLPFLVRMADLRELAREMRRGGVEWSACRAIAAIDPNRVPKRFRGTATALNRFWFGCRLPWAAGVVIIGRKT